MKIMIVDDEHVIRMGIRTVIQRSGREWIISGEAVDGIDAVEQMERELPDVVLTDIRMPEMDGIELTKHIKRNFPEVTVIIISGYAEFNFAQEAIRFGALDYILKPTKPEDLVAVLQNAQRLKMDRQVRAEEEQRLKQEVEILRNQLAESLARQEVPEQNEQIRPHQYRKVIEHAIEYMHGHYAQDLTLKHVADKLYINHSYFCDLFRQETGEYFSDCLTRIRVEKAKELLLSRLELHSYEVADLVGYKDPKYFSQVFKRLTGATPTEFREGRLGAVRKDAGI